MTETKKAQEPQERTLQEEVRELEGRAEKAVDAAAAGREDQSATEETRSRLDREATEALDAATAAKERLSRDSKVDRMVQERQQERKRERKAAAAEETRQRHEERYNELTRERRKLEERTEKEAAKLRSTLEELLELDKEHLREYTLAGGKIPLASTPFKAQLVNWFRDAFGKPYNTGPVPYSGTDPHNGAGLIERDAWAKEARVPQKETA